MSVGEPRRGLAVAPHQLPRLSRLPESVWQVGGGLSLCSTCTSLTHPRGLSTIKAAASSPSTPATTPRLARGSGQCLALADLPALIACTPPQSLPNIRCHPLALGDWTVDTFVQVWSIGLVVEETRRSKNCSTLKREAQFAREARSHANTCVLSLMPAAIKSGTLVFF